MTAYWTCTRCKRVIAYPSMGMFSLDDEVYDPDTIDGARVCRACVAKEIEASKQSAEGGKEKAC